MDIEDKVIRLPLNTWPTDKHERDIGRWYNLGLSEGLEAMSLGPFARAYRWPVADIMRLASDVKKVICNREYHIYNNL